MAAVKSCCRFTVKLGIWLLAGTWCNLYNMWSFSMEPHGIKCKFKPIGGNNTGIKVLNYGMGKTGTTTMARALYDVGLNSYHSEEFQFHVWAPLADLFYQRPENGAKWIGHGRLATPWAPAYKGHSWLWRGDKKTGSDQKVLREISSEDLAAAISKCRVEAMVFDGLEDLFEPVYKMSPEAKVIVLDWRTHKEYTKSLMNFGVAEFLGLLALNFMVVSMHIFPWNAIVFPVLDPLLGSPIENKMRNGTPFHQGTLKTHDREHPLVMLWRMQFTERRTCQHWMSGLGIAYKNETAWDNFWDWVKIHVPAERRFHWNMRKHGHKELCKFLNISGNPICNKEGPIKYGGVSVMHHERENKKSFAIVCCYLLLLHYLGWHIFWYIVPLFFSILTSPLKILLPGTKSKAE